MVLLLLLHFATIPLEDIIKRKGKCRLPKNYQNRPWQILTNGQTKLFSAFDNILLQGPFHQIRFA